HEVSVQPSMGMEDARNDPLHGAVLALRRRPRREPAAAWVDAERAARRVPSSVAMGRLGLRRQFGDRHVVLHRPGVSVHRESGLPPEDALHPGRGCRRAVPDVARGSVGDGSGYHGARAREGARGLTNRALDWRDLLRADAAVHRQRVLATRRGPWQPRRAVLISPIVGCQTGDGWWVPALPL